MGQSHQVTINRSGQVRIPKTMRAQLGLTPGTRLAIETHNDEIRLKPLSDEPKLVNKAGVLVVQSLAVAQLEGVEKQEREKHLAKQAWGSAP